jgi:hypothetical protein
VKQAKAIAPDKSDLKSNWTRGERVRYAKLTNDMSEVNLAVMDNEGVGLCDGYGLRPVHGYLKMVGAADLAGD